MTARICQYGSCMEDVGEQGVTVSLRKETPDGETRAIFCCASHAAASLLQLAYARGEAASPMPNRWRIT